MSDSVKNCGNCLHWNTVKANRMGILSSLNLGICDKNAIDPDCGNGAVVLLGPECNCLNDANEWQPHPDFVAEHREQQAYSLDPATFNGVSAGVDFPATM